MGRRACGCHAETQRYCREWRRLARQSQAAFDLYATGGLTWDEYQFFVEEVIAHAATW